MVLLSGSMRAVASQAVLWACGAAWHAGGQEFESPWLHFEESPAKGRAFCCLAVLARFIYCLENFHVEVTEGLVVIAIKILDDL